MLTIKLNNSIALRIFDMIPKDRCTIFPGFCCLDKLVKAITEKNIITEDHACMMPIDKLFCQQKRLG